MRAAPYGWLSAYLAAHLPELEGMTAGPEGRAQAQRWFEGLLACFRARNLSTARQQKNYLVMARNAIRQTFGKDHPALAVVRFDEATWVTVNQPTHDRVEARNLHSRLLPDPDAIVARAQGLLSRKASGWADLAVGLGVATGRRISELLGASTQLALKTAYSVRFTGQLKHRAHHGEPFTFEIPTLCPAHTVLDAWKRLRVMRGAETLLPQQINQRFGRGCREAANRHFAGLIPPREGEDDLYMHLFRAVYATIAVHYYCPPEVNPTLFKAEIQGHRMIARAANEPQRRSYTASRHYDDYAIAGADGHNRDGRQGVRLGRPGVDVLEALQPPALLPQPLTPMPKPKIPTAKPGKTARSAKTKKPTPPAKPQFWRTSDAAHQALSKTWKGAVTESQAHVLDRVLSFANAARELARHLELPDPAPETLLNALADRYRLLADEAKEAAGRVEAAEAQQQARGEAAHGQQRKLERHVEDLTAERDGLVARVAGLQRQLKEAAAQSGPRVELLPLAHQLLELSSRASGLAPAALQEALMRLAMDAIAQAAGPASTPAARVPVPPTATHAPALAQKPPAPVTPPSPVVPVAEAQAVEPPASVEHPRPDPIPTPETSPEPVGAEPPPTPAEGTTPARSTRPLKRHSTKAEGKLEKAFRFLTDVNDHAERRDDRYFVNESILFSLTGCFRPAVARFVAAREEDINELNRKHGLGPGHNRGKARTQPDALPTLIKTFKDSALNAGVDQPF